MALVFIDRTCHRLSYRVIGRSKCELSQTKKISASFGDEMMQIFNEIIAKIYL